MSEREAIDIYFIDIRRGKRFDSFVLIPGLMMLELTSVSMMYM